MTSIRQCKVNPETSKCQPSHNGAAGFCDSGTMTTTSPQPTANRVAIPRFCSSSVGPFEPCMSSISYLRLIVRWTDAFLRARQRRKGC